MTRLGVVKRFRLVSSPICARGGVFPCFPNITPLCGLKPQQLTETEIHTLVNRSQRKVNIIGLLIFTPFDFPVDERRQ